MKKANVFSKLFITFAMACAVVGLSSGKVEAKSNSIKVTAPSGKTVKVAKGKKVKLQTKIKKLKNKKIIYKSKNPSIAKVSASGIVKGVKAGKTKITVKVGTKKKTVKVVVYKKAVKEIKLNATTKKLTKGMKFKLTASVSPKKNVSKVLKFSSSDKKVVKVDKKGVISAVGNGTANVEVKATDGSNKKAICKVSVATVGIEKVSVRSLYSLDVELTAPKKLEMEDFKVGGKYQAATNYTMKQGVKDLHTEDNIHYEVVLEEKLIYSSIVKVDVNCLPGVKSTSIVVDKECFYYDHEALVWGAPPTKVEGNSYDKYIVGKVGDEISISVLSGDSYSFDYAYPAKMSASNLPEGITALCSDDGTFMSLRGTYKKELKGHKAVITCIDAKGRKFYINYIFYVVNKDSVASVARDAVDIAYKPNKNSAVAGKTEYYVYVNMTDLDSMKDEYYSSCTNFKATGLPGNVRINQNGYLEVVDTNKAVKPGTYNIKISAVTPSGKAFSFVYKLKLVEGVTISGKMIDASGEPIVNETLSFWKEYDANAQSFYINALSDEKGNYSIRVVPGTYSITGGVYNTYKRSFNKNMKYDIKSNYYKVTFTNPLFTSASDYIYYSPCLFFNTATNYYKVAGYKYEGDEDKYKKVEVYAYLRKGVTYKIYKNFDNGLEVDGNYYSLAEKEFKCTGQKKIALEYTKGS